MVQHHNQPSQPPKQAAYDSPQNPVTHSPYEQQHPSQPKRQYGDPVPAISRRSASSKPSSDEAMAHLLADRRREQREMRNSPDVDLEYGVEQQPNEGDIAYAVEHRSDEARKRAQAGAHAGPVGSAYGPGHPAYHPGGEEREYAADLARKKQEHDRVLGARASHSPPEPDGETAEREMLRARRLQEQKRLHVKDAVHEATGEPVVGL
ncbi:hypothetical protein BDV59DRAFT_43528 [Aspergillus ambiguus]|uniref:uncharacterized protein n=1 Tax=Aspergillus ambiguus TaxID=176160 RepID=UPI003CCD50AE